MILSKTLAKHRIIKENKHRQHLVSGQAPNPAFVPMYVHQLGNKTLQDLLDGQLRLPAPAPTSAP